ncbi:MAG: beta-Ala-His dipeptidase [Finegoldia sp.]|nr:beta-Ala-His dipeptidase [Finegoldia sp.]
MENNRVIDNFREISKVPRCSYDQERISSFLASKAEKMGLDYEVDEKLNIIIRKEASADRKGEPGVILQAHMDMVCEKEDDSDHDFSKDPIELIEEDGFLSANKTTLGADDGIGVAMAFAILEDDDLSHPDLEVVITTDEEVGMGGVVAIKEDSLKGKYLINIDSEEEGIVTVGCSGGDTLVVEIPVTREDFGAFFYEISIAGYRGGHSGQDINTGRLNAIKSSLEILEKLKENHDIRLIAFDGGTKQNAIARSASLKIGSADEIKEDEIDIKDYKTKEKDMIFSLKKLEKDQALDEKSNKNVINFLKAMPSGVLGMVNENLVETSANQAIIKSEADKISFTISLRSSVLKNLEKLEEEIGDQAEKVKGKVGTEGYYVPWEMKEDSRLRDKALEVYKKLTGKDMEVQVIHAGLEAANFAEKYPDMDIISIGPDMEGIHTPAERLDLKSTDRVYNFLKRLIEEL